MSGQIGSKVWLCEKLEPIMLKEFDRNTIVWLLGGWYGMTNFLLQTRRIAPVGRVVSYDIDPEVKRGALVLNESFELTKAFNAETADVNTLDYDVVFPPDVVINTSTEHMESTEWFDRIPAGTMCVFQTNNMPHDDHVHCCNSVDDLRAQFPLSVSFYAGSKTFVYADWSFTRYMHIGLK